MRRVHFSLAGALVCAALLVVSLTAQSPSPQRVHALRITEFATDARQSDTAALATLRVWDQYVTAMERDGSLSRVEIAADANVAGRTHERLSQRHRGVRVFGGDLTRQRNGFGQTVSLFGAVYDQIDVNPAPRLTRTTARDAITAALVAFLGATG